MATINKVPSEDQEQAWLVAWVRKAYPSALLFAIPNGGKRHVKTALLLKATGVVSGIPDLFLASPVPPYAGLFIEMKRAKGGAVSAEQKKQMQALRAAGYRVEVCKGAEAAKGVIVDYLGA